MHASKSDKIYRGGQMITYVQQFVAYLPPKHILIVDFDNVDIEVMLESFGCKSKPIKSDIRTKT